MPPRTRRASRKGSKQQRGSLEAQLALLEHAQLVRPLAESELAYFFKHALVQETAYESLLRKRRRELHLQIAQVFRELSEENPALLAHHYWEGEDWANAAAYSMRAGEHAMQAYALREALEHYARVLQALPKLPDATPEQQIDGTLGWIRPASKLEPYAELLEQLKQAEQLARAANDKRRLAQVLHWIADVHFAHGYNTRAMPALFENYQLASELGDDRLSVIPSYWMAFFMVDRDPRAALAQFEKVIELARKHHNREIEAHAIATKGFAHARLGEFTQAETELQQAFELVRRINSPAKEADVNNLAGFTYLDMGDVDRALEYSQRGAQKAMAANVRECASAGWLGVGFCQLQSQKLGEAQDAFSASMQFADSAGADQLRNQAFAGLAVARFLSGRREAIQDMETALANARAIDDQYGIAFLSEVLAEAHAQAGDLARAETDLDLALAYYRAAEMRPYLARALQSRARLYERQGRAAEAERARAEAEALT